MNFLLSTFTVHLVVGSTDRTLDFSTDFSKATKFSGSAWFQGVDVKNCTCILSPRYISGALELLFGWLVGFDFGVLACLDLVYQGYYLQILCCKEYTIQVQDIL